MTVEEVYVTPDIKLKLLLLKIIHAYSDGIK
jgi:hypothetical protein